MNKAVFLDRDGTITVEPPHYAHKLSDLKLYPGVPEAILRLNDTGFIVIVVSNQAGIARGYYAEEDTIKFNAAMADLIAAKGARIDDIYFCPHHIEGTVEQYAIDCDCRKPKTGMLLQAVKKFDISLTDSFFIGDNISDIRAGQNAGCKTILVKTGHGAEVMKQEKVTSDYIAEDLVEAVDFIINSSI